MLCAAATAAESSQARKTTQRPIHIGIRQSRPDAATVSIVRSASTRSSTTRASRCAPPLPFVGRDRCRIGDIERGKFRFGLNGDQPVTFFGGESAQSFALGAQCDAGAAAEIEIADLEVAAFVEPIKPEARLAELVERAGEV